MRELGHVSTDTQFSVALRVRILRPGSGGGEGGALDWPFVEIQSVGLDFKLQFMAALDGQFDIVLLTQ